MLRTVARQYATYIYLSDFTSKDVISGLAHTWSNVFLEKLRACRWFTRGWTLQELLAPYSVEFSDEDGQYSGDRIDLADEMSSVTMIWPTIHYGVGFGTFSTANVATRMSWVPGWRIKLIA